MSDIAPRGTFTINEFCKWASLGRTRVYEEIGNGSLPAIKIGRRTLITVAAAEAWLRSQPSYLGAN